MRTPIKNKIVIADDHPMLLKGLYDELIDHGYKVVAACENGQQALKAILEHKPSFALLDIDMPLLTGFEVVKRAREHGLQTNFIVLSFHREAAYITQAKTLQIQGYLLKEDPFSEIEKCLFHVQAGRDYFSPSFENNVLVNADTELTKLSQLTPSETTILKMIAESKESPHIADELCVSARTVEKHRSNIINKLELASGSNSLVKWALTNKDIIFQL